MNAAKKKEGTSGADYDAWEIVENIHEVFFVTNPDASVMHYISPAYEKVWGVSRESLYAAPRSWVDAVVPEDKQRVMGLLAQGRLDGMDYRLRRADGSIRWISARAFPVKDAAGTVVRMVGIAEDVTERRALEEQFLQAQKMEAIGRLAGGVAHDFNNLLTVIMGFSQLLERRFPKDDPDRRDFEEIVHASDRAAALARQLLVFSRKHTVQLVPLNINETVEQMRKLLGRVIGEDIYLGTCMRPDLDNISGDTGRIEQVIMNLAVNARDAMPQGGKLTIETRNVELTDESVWKLKGLTPGRYVMLAVSDTGMGMTEEVKARIFEPFFTTKGPGKGTGLGLSTVFEIVHQCQGHISVYSEPGKGTSFKIYFPRVEGIVCANAAEKIREAAGGTETVLIVEDEKDICALEERVLNGKGYKTVKAMSPAEALSLAEGITGPAPLLVTDVVMPGMSGPQLAEKLKVKWPDMKVLYISGYTEGHLHDQDLLKAGTGLLHKPFAPAVLAHQVREILDGAVRL